jgi:BirA family biotin operon repressor/biotin-[acetyl-CoA-carboxylase] ligase
VAQALEERYGVRPGIKWVNDLLLDGKKICGILCESILGEGGYFDAVIVGIGVNLGPEDFPPELQEIAGTVLDADRYCPQERELLAAAVVERLRGFEQALEEGTFLDDYRARLVWLGQPVRVIRGEDVREATALSVDRYAALRVRYADGSEEDLVGGEISLRLQ